MGHVVTWPRLEHEERSPWRWSTSAGKPRLRSHHPEIDDFTEPDLRCRPCVTKTEARARVVELMRVVRSDREPGQSRATFHMFGGRDGFYLTEILSETPTGSRIKLRVGWKPIGDPKSRLSDSIADLLNGDLDRLAAGCRS